MSTSVTDKEKEFRYNLKRLLRQGYPQGICLSELTVVYQRWFKGEHVDPEKLSAEYKDWGWRKLFQNNMFLKSTFKIVRRKGVLYVKDVKHVLAGNETAIDELALVLELSSYRNLLWMRAMRKWAKDASTNNSELENQSRISISSDSDSDSEENKSSTSSNTATAIDNRQSEEISSAPADPPPSCSVSVSPAPANPPPSCSVSVSTAPADPSPSCSVSVSPAPADPPPSCSVSVSPVPADPPPTCSVSVSHAPGIETISAPAGNSTLLMNEDELSKFQELTRTKLPISGEAEAEFIARALQFDVSIFLKKIDEESKMPPKRPKFSTEANPGSSCSKLKCTKPKVQKAKGRPRKKPSNTSVGTTGEAAMAMTPILPGSDFIDPNEMIVVNDEVHATNT